MNRRRALLLVAAAAYSSALAGLARAQPVRLVKDIRPGAFGGMGGIPLVDVNDVLFFVANDGVNGAELWKSDGTAAGTVMVRDILPGATGSFPGFLINMNGTLFFGANDGTNGEELWRSDGTAAGTVMVKDINPGPASSSPLNPIVLNGVLFFSAREASTGLELWRSDGTAAGTTIVRDINSGAGDSMSGNNTFATMNGALYFAALTSANGFELWKSDGTLGGTAMVRDIFPGAGQSFLDFLTPVNGTLFFKAQDGVTGFELWRSDGTTAGTTLVRDIFPGAGSSSPGPFVALNNTLFFQARDGANGQELWRSDGSAGGTVIVADIFPGVSSSVPVSLTGVNGMLFFSAASPSVGQELWSSDGTDVFLVRDIVPGPSSSFPEFLTNANGTLFFRANDGPHGVELWRSDGAELGTMLLQDINPGAGSSSPQVLTRVGSKLFFDANDGVVGRELWATVGLEFFTCTSTNAQNLLEWVNPAMGTVDIVHRTDRFPTSASDGTPLTVPPGTPGQHQELPHASLANDTTYFYGAFVNEGFGFSPGRFTKGRPQAAPPQISWSYNTGATSLSPPGIGSVYAVSNDGILHSMNAGTTGGDWPTGWTPFAMNLPAQGRQPVVTLPAGTFPSAPSATKVTFIGSQDGRVYAVDALSGAEIWKSPLLGSLIQAAPAAMFSAAPFSGAYDLVFVGTRNPSSSENLFYGLKVSDGTIAWTFGSGLGIGIISGQAQVDYLNNRVYFASRPRLTNTQTVWCLQLSGPSNAPSASQLWSVGAGAIDGSPILHNNRIYVGSNTSIVRALDATTGGVLMTRNLGDGAVKGFPFPRMGTNHLLVSTTNTVWSLQDNNTTAGAINWSIGGVGMPSIPLVGGPFVFFGSSNGNFYQATLAQGPASLKSITIGDGLAVVGAPSLDVMHSLVYVGTESGAVYAVQVPLP